MAELAGIFLRDSQPVVGSMQEPLLFARIQATAARVARPLLLRVSDTVPPGPRLIQYSTSCSPFSEIIFWNSATILSRRAITSCTSSLER